MSPTLFSYAPGHASCAAHHRLCSTGCAFPPPAWALTWQEASAVRMLARPAQFCAASGSASLLPLPSSSRASVGLGVSTLMGTKRVAGATESVVCSAACRACTPWLVMKRVAARRHEECCLFRCLPRACALGLTLRAWHQCPATYFSLSLSAVRLWVACQQPRLLCGKVAVRWEHPLQHCARSVEEADFCVHASVRAQRHAGMTSEQTAHCVMGCDTQCMVGLGCFACNAKSARVACMHARRCTERHRGAAGPLLKPAQQAYVNTEALRSIAGAPHSSPVNQHVGRRWRCALRQVPAAPGSHAAGHAAMHVLYSLS